MSEQKWTPEQALEQISKAHDKVNDICTGREKWKMSVPAQKDDPDILIVDALGSAYPYVAACQGAPESIQPGAVKAMAECLKEILADDNCTSHLSLWLVNDMHEALRLYHGSDQ